MGKARGKYQRKQISSSSNWNTATRQAKGFLKNAMRDKGRKGRKRHGRCRHRTLSRDFYFRKGAKGKKSLVPLHLFVYNRF